MRVIGESSGSGGINVPLGRFYVTANSGIELDSSQINIKGAVQMNGKNITGAGNLVGTTATGGWPITMINIQGITGTPYMNVTSGSRSWGVNMWSSDMRLKKNIKKSSGGATKIVNKLMVCSYDWRERNTHTDYGLIAQNVERILPQAVLNVEQPTSFSLKQIIPEGIIPVLVESIQELNERIVYLEKN